MHHKNNGLVQILWVGFTVGGLLFSIGCGPKNQAASADASTVDAGGIDANTKDMTAVDTAADHTELKDAKVISCLDDSNCTAAISPDQQVPGEPSDDGDV